MRGATLAIALVIACGSGAPRGPEVAFDRTRLAVVSGDPRLVFDMLDAETRWALDTVWDYQRKIGGLLDGLPAEVRERERVRIAAALETGSTRDFFVVQTRLGDPWGALGGSADGLGTRARVERVSDREAIVVTTTGVRVPVAAGPDGVWGWSGLREEAVRWRDVVANDLARLQEDAAALGRGE